MKKPFLVRVVNKKMDKDEMAQASRRFNEVSTQALQLDAEGVSKSKLVKPATIGILQSDLQEFDTLREYLNSGKSEDLINSLANDGVIEEMQRSRITNNEGLLNSEGKNLVEAVLRGLIVQDYDLIRTTPASIVDKIDRAIPALAQLKARGGEWDVSDLVARSLKQIQRAVSGGRKAEDIGLHFATIPLIPDPDHDDKGVQVLATTIAKATPKELAARLNVLAADGAKQADGGAFFMADMAPDAEKSFAKAFLQPVASIGGTVVGGFDPENNERHAAILWAAKASKGHKIETANAKLGNILASPDETEEAKEEARKKIRLLSSYSGAISIYEPVLKNFAYKPTSGDTLLKRG